MKEFQFLQTLNVGISGTVKLIGWDKEKQKHICMYTNIETLKETIKNYENDKRISGTIS